MRRRHHSYRPTLFILFFKEKQRLRSRFQRETQQKKKSKKEKKEKLRIVLEVESSREKKRYGTNKKTYFSLMPHNTEETAPF